MRSVILSLGTIWEDVWITYIHWDILSRKKPRQHRYEIYWRVHETGKNYRNSSLLISGPSLENVSNINLKFSISTHESRLKNWEFASISRWSAQHGRWYWISESQFSGLIGEWVYRLRQTRKQLMTRRRRKLSSELHSESSMLCKQRVRYYSDINFNQSSPWLPSTTILASIHFMMRRLLITILSRSLRLFCNHFCWLLNQKISDLLFSYYWSNSVTHSGQYWL